MELYYTDKEKHIHKFLSIKGWTEKEINKAMFLLTRWTTALEMPIETYYKLIMKECNYEEYIKMESLFKGSPEEFLWFRGIHRKGTFLFILGTAFLTLLIFTWIKGGG